MGTMNLNRFARLLGPAQGWEQYLPPVQAKVLATFRETLAEMGPVSGAQQAAARRAGLTHANYHAVLLKLLKKAAAFDAMTGAAPAAPASPALPAPQDHELRRAREEARALRKALEEAADREAALLRFRESLAGLIREPLDPVTWRHPEAPSEGEPEIPILFTSDFQWGERIQLEHMAGLNRFDRQVASARYFRLIDRTIELCTRHHAGKPPPCFYYLRGGDAISGEIHEELAETNDLLSVPALKDLAAHEAEGLRRLKAALKCPIVVISVPGNHDRSSKKPKSKAYVETSFDSIVSWHLEATLGREDGFTFLTPKHQDALFRVYGTTFLLTHGDQVGSRGGQGFIGPAATIARGMKKVVDNYAAIGQPLDVVLVGHWHTPLMLEHGFSNGCLPGYSEFARSHRMRPSPPSQWLFHVHPRRGLVNWRLVFCGGPGEGLLCDRQENGQASVDPFRTVSEQEAADA